ncbi:MAG TPA: hypothetical protein PKO15_01855 [Fibrobacteria bacterium]|nr:hypothetical protein [Fibrobacteria bacterium]HOX50345.1 hypothetical protein [Fibrobacteria bacterium]
MTESPDILEIEDRYQSLRRALMALGDRLVHAREEREILDAFRSAGTQAVELFAGEEEAMASCDCPALEINRQGHRKFLRDLGQVLHHLREDRCGFHAASVLRRDVMPWLHEHHRVVDRQVVHQLRRRGELSVA